MDKESDKDKQLREDIIALKAAVIYMSKNLTKSKETALAMTNAFLAGYDEGYVQKTKKKNKKENKRG